MDDDLVVRARIDRTAFGLLYDHYYPGVLRYCVRRLFDLTVAEDVVSDVFLAAASKLREFPGRSETDFRRWLFRITTNSINAYLRQTRRRQELWQAAARHRQERCRGSSPHSWEALDWPTVYQAVLELEQRDQTILMLHFFAGLTHEEIGAVVDATPGAVRTALCRTLGRLREKFDPSSPEGAAPREMLKDCHG
jgi:RNA polymerase sigma-70 factor (ECF subfamily)